MLTRASVILMLLGAACMSPSAPSRAGTLDVLDYLIGMPDTWPRYGDTNHHQHQVVDVAERRVTWTKYTLGWMFEAWRWDANYVYHVVDHAIDNQRWEHYVFSDGRWMPRRLTPGIVWELYLADNRLTWYDADCNPRSERPAPYRVRAWHAGLMDAGGDLGVRDVIVLAYQPSPGSAEANTEELFYFAKGAGWYRWTRGAADVRFNRIGGVARLPTPLCAKDFQG
jgi:hypothetical protein